MSQKGEMDESEEIFALLGEDNTEIIISTIEDNIKERTDYLDIILFTKEAFEILIDHSCYFVIFQEITKRHFSALSQSIKQILESFEREECTLDADSQTILPVIELCKILIEAMKRDRERFFDNLEAIINTSIEVMKSTFRFLKQRDFRMDAPQTGAYSLENIARQSCNLSSLLCEYLNSLHSSMIKELENFSEICTGLAYIARTQSCLGELKSSVVCWRTFNSYLQSFSDASEPPCDLNYSLSLLVEEIGEGLQMIYAFSQNQEEDKVPDEKIFARIIKMLCFCLKIIMNICKNFSTFMQECYQPILHLLIKLYKFSPYSLIFTSSPNSLKNMLETQLYIAIDPLLSCVISDTFFKEELKNLCKKPGCEELSAALSEPFLKRNETSLLLINLKIIQLILQEEHDSKLRDSWCLTLIENILKLFPSCHSELCYPQMLPDVMHSGQAQEMISLYAYTLCHICGLFCSLSPLCFSQAERQLFVAFFEFNHWKSLLVSDILCFLARYGTESLCIDYCKLIVGMLELSSCPEKMCFMSKLFLRLTSLLSCQSREYILKNLQPDQNQHIENSSTIKSIKMLLFISLVPDYSSFVKFLDRTKSISNQALHNSDDVTETMPMLCLFNRFFSFRFFINFTQSNKILRNFCEELFSLTDRLTRLKLEDPPTRSLIVGMVAILCSTSEVLSSKEIYKLLIHSVEFSSVYPELFIPISNLLSNIRMRDFGGHPHEKEIIWMIAALLAWLISNDVSFIHQIGLDTLTFIGQYTKHEEVLPLCISFCREKDKQDIQHYLSFESNSNLSEMMKFLDSQTEEVQSHQHFTNETDSSISEPIMKKRKIDHLNVKNVNLDPKAYLELIKNLDLIKDILRGSFNCDENQKKCITSSLNEVNILWEKFIQHS